MTLNGQLKDYSLPELLNTMEQGSKTGTLTLRIFNKELNIFVKTDISFSNGYIIAVSKDLASRDLIDFLYEKQFLSQSTVKSIIQVSDDFKLDLPLGDYLQKEGKIDSIRLKIAFDLQVVNKIISLFEVSDAWFTFNPRLRAPMILQTGLRIRSAEVNLLGLRNLQNWEHLSDKLPEGNFALIKQPPSAIQPSLLSDQKDNSIDFSSKLIPVEHQILQCSDGSMDLKMMANSLNLPIEEVKKVSFRLISAGLIEELPMVSVKPTQSAMKSAAPPACSVNSSFLANLNGFLKNKSAKNTQTSV